MNNQVPLLYGSGVSAGTPSRLTALRSLQPHPGALRFETLRELFSELIMQRHTPDCEDNPDPGQADKPQKFSRPENEK